MAPELISSGEVSTACDVYAFGVLMWECYTSVTPYKGLLPPQVLMGVVSSQLRPAFASTTPPGYTVRRKALHRTRVRRALS
jgi:serine/threonine protein kinase